MYIVYYFILKLVTTPRQTENKYCKTFGSVFFV